MISAGQLAVAHVKLKSFSAIARSVMISAILTNLIKKEIVSFSAIARSVMISASFMRLVSIPMRRFSAIARSVMISAPKAFDSEHSCQKVSVL